MAASKDAKGKSPKGENGTPAVDAYLRQLDHPLKAVLAGIRKIILGADRGISEGIKWNAPSFFYKDYFATTGLRSPDFVQVVLHTGAKPKASASHGLEIGDPMKLLTWHAKDRCSLKVVDVQDLKAKQKALQSIVQQWIRQM